MQSKTAESLKKYNVPFFQSMSDESLSMLADASDRRVLEPCHQLFEVGSDSCL